MLEKMHGCKLVQNHKVKINFSSSNEMACFQPIKTHKEVWTHSVGYPLRVGKFCIFLSLLSLL